MFGLGTGEIVIIVLIALLLFGANKLPQIGRALGRTVGEVKKGLKEGFEEEQKNKDQDLKK